MLYAETKTDDRRDNDHNIVRADLSPQREDDEHGNHGKRHDGLDLQARFCKMFLICFASLPFRALSVYAGLMILATKNGRRC